MFSNLSIFILSYILIILSVVGFGFLSTILFNRFNISNNLGYYGLIGLFFLGIYSYLSSIFIKHNYFHNSILLIIGLFSFYFYLRRNLKSLKPQIYNFLIIFIILFVASIIFKMHDDFSYYHFPYSYILTQHNFIFGLGHLDLGFRTPSSLFYLNSIFYLPYIKFYMFMMPAILILGFSNSIIYEKIINNIKYNKINYITYFALLTIIFINIFFYRISEHGTDKSAQILIFLLLIEILIFLNLNKIDAKSLSKIYLLVALVISLKAFYLLYSIFFIILVFKVLSKKKIYSGIIFFIKNIYFVPLIIFFILIIGSYFFSTGCLIYPVSFTCFENFSWSIKKLEVIELNNWYELWSKAGAGPEYRIDNRLEYISNFNWVANWIDKYFFNKVSDFLLGLSAMLIVINMFLFSTKKKIINFPNIKILFFPLIILIIEWFYNHPALRYGGYCLIASIIFIFFSIRLSKYKLENYKLKQRFNLLILITIVIFLGRNFNRILYEIEFYNYKPMQNINYIVKDSYFDKPNLIKRKITNYNLCKNNNQNCTTDDKLKIKKYFNNYILILEND